MSAGGWKDQPGPDLREPIASRPASYALGASCPAVPSRGQAAPCRRPLGVGAGRWPGRARQRRVRGRWSPARSPLTLVSLSRPGRHGEGNGILRHPAGEAQRLLGRDQARLPQAGAEVSPRQEPQRGRAGKNVVHQLSVSLEDLYNGVTRKLALQKNVICEKCKGYGGKKGAIEKCPMCKGRGMQVLVQQIGPGMVQQIQTMCSECKGQGERINPKDRCDNCNGCKVVREKKIIEVHIDKGMKDGQKLVFHGEGDQEPDLEPGDVIIVLDQKDHSVFQRRGHDLIMKMKIHLSESLCGFKRTIETLDNRVLFITSRPGEVIKHGDLKCILNEGMPIYKSPLDKGYLIIQFMVMFPEHQWLPTEKLPILEALLPPREVVMITEEMDQVELTEFDPREQTSRSSREVYEEDEEGPRTGVQCQTS